MLIESHQKTKRDAEYEAKIRGMPIVEVDKQYFVTNNPKLLTRLLRQGINARLLTVTNRSGGRSGKRKRSASW